MLAPRLSNNNPQALPQTAWGFTPDSTLGSGDARNVEGIGIQRASKRGLSTSWQQYGVVEGASVSWNSAARSPGRRRVRWEVPDIEHGPQ